MGSTKMRFCHSRMAIAYSPLLRHPGREMAEHVPEARCWLELKCGALGIIIGTNAMAIFIVSPQLALARRSPGKGGWANPSGYSLRRSADLDPPTDLPPLHDAPTDHAT